MEANEDKPLEEHLPEDSQKPEVKDEDAKDKDIELKKLKLRALREYRQISRKYPLVNGRRKGIKKELELLKRKYPDVSFPGSHKLKIETSQYGIRVRELADKLEEILKVKLNKSYSSIEFPKTLVKVLLKFSKPEMLTGKELMRESGLSLTTIVRVAGILEKLGFLENSLSGKYHFYAITEAGKKFLEETSR